jgi:isopenicillin N synthase-like dioxygenase
MIENWQWKHGTYESDPFESLDAAVYWADRATTGADDDGIAVRRVLVEDWRRLNSQGWMDPEPEPEPEPDLADTLLAWADQMEAESPTVGRMLAMELRNRINTFKEEK